MKENKNKRCHIQLTDTEKNVLTQRAKKLGLSFSEYAVLCMKSEMDNKNITVEKVIKNTVKSNLSNVYCDDIKEILDFISSKKMSSNYSEQLDRLLYTQSKYPDKFDIDKLEKLEKYIEELKETETVIMKSLEKILNERKKISNKDIKKQLNNVTKN